MTDPTIWHALAPVVNIAASVLGLGTGLLLAFVSRALYLKLKVALRQWRPTPVD